MKTGKRRLLVGGALSTLALATLLGNCGHRPAARADEGKVHGKTMSGTIVVKAAEKK